MAKKTAKAPKAAKTAKAAKTVRITLDTEETAALEEARKAYPDKPSPAETAKRLLDMELMRSKRGAR